jgi:hypothetical protein
VRALLLAAALLLVPATAGAQWLDPDRRWNGDQWQHAAAGAVLDITFRLPLVAPGWRTRPERRLLLVLGTSIVFEALQVHESAKAGWLGEEGGGFGLLDILATMMGALSVEIVTHIVWRK